MTAGRWHQKADSFSIAWKGKFAAWPVLAVIIGSLAQGEHETHNGDDWPDEHNVAAIQLRILTAAEKAVLARAGVHLPANNAGIAAAVEAARAALAAAAEAGEIPEPAGSHGEGAALHIDSSPDLPKPGYYWVFFRKSQDDIEGYGVFIHITAENHPACRAVLERGGTMLEYAAALYAAGYYQGFYKKTERYKLDPVTKKWMLDAAGPKTGAELNIAAYASAMQRSVPEITEALAGYTYPSEEPPHPAFVMQWKIFGGTRRDSSLTLGLTADQRHYAESLDAVRQGTGLEGLDAVDAIQVDADAVGPGDPTASDEYLTTREEDPPDTEPAT